MARRKERSVFAAMFAEMAIKVWKGDKSVYEDLKRIIPRPSELEESEGMIIGKGPNGMSVGIPYGLDPVNALVQIGFLYAGMMWPFVPWFHDANKIAREMWREAVRMNKK